eukprot:3487375-Rhodomonas_salina.2
MDPAVPHAASVLSLQYHTLLQYRPYSTIRCISTEPSVPHSASVLNPGPSQGDCQTLDPPKP